ncbi:MAG: DUF1570 domain-containing protein [Planctomycetota bacterium]
MPLSYLNERRRWERLRAFLLRLSLLGIACLIGLSSAAAGDKTVLRERARRMAKVGNYPPRAWKDAFVFENSLYKVTTNTSEEVAKYICLLMSFAQQTFRATFNYEDEVPKIDICAYRTEEEYRKALGGLGLDARAIGYTTGMFVEQNGVYSIHVAYVRKYEDTLPTHVLLHEGTHEFVALGLDFKIPDGSRGRIVGNPPTLRSTPLWLNEGLATYMETSYYDGEKLIVGHVNRSRLEQLQGEIRKNKSVPFRKLFRARQGQFQGSHYAAAWGVVYWFLHASDPQIQEERRSLLRAFLRRVRKGFMEDPKVEFAQRFLEQGENFAPAWDSFVEKKGAQVFLQVMLGDNASEKDLDEWEKGWKRWILSLDPASYYGGLYSNYDDR